MGRWMSPDWSAKEDPVPYAKLDDPQSLNLYQYVGNNPLNRADADGHDPTDPDCRCLALGQAITHTEIVVHAALVNALVDIRDAVRAMNGTEPAMLKEPAAPAVPVGVAGGPQAAPAPATPAAGDKQTQPLVGNNPKDGGTRTNTDLPGGHDAATGTFGEQTAGQNVRTDPNTGHQVSEDGSRLRLNPDGTARVDLPNRGTKPNGETVHFNNPDPKPPLPK